MIARAPGKLVLSGAYSVLEGAPCIVAAVDRFVIADSDREASFVTDEVRVAVARGAMERPVWFDASALREASPDGTSRKLGLGSSAAILAASLAAVHRDRHADLESMRRALFPIALAAHREAQGGGSGVDVAASVFGGVTIARPDPSTGALDVSPHALPEGTVIEVFASPVSASTRDLLARVRALREADPARHRACLDAAKAGARSAIEARNTADFVRAVAAQTDALGALGEASGAPIVTPDVTEIRVLAEREGGTFAPSGAGGGDIAFFVGAQPASPALVARAAELGLSHLRLSIGAVGAG